MLVYLDQSTFDWVPKKDKNQSIKSDRQLSNSEIEEKQSVMILKQQIISLLSFVSFYKLIHPENKIKTESILGHHTLWFPRNLRHVMYGFHWVLSCFCQSSCHIMMITEYFSHMISPIFLGRIFVLGTNMNEHFNNFDKTKTIMYKNISFPTHLLLYIWS